MKIKYLVLAILLGASVTLVACKEKGPMEKMGESMDNAADEVSDAVEDAGDEIEDAADEVEDAIDG